MGMKGYIDKNGNDRAPCGSCKHKDKMTISAACYNCISAVDLALHKPNSETEFAAYEESDERREATPWDAQSQREDEAAVEMAEYCERYGPTYNAEDGSM